ncbi:MAG TPA: TIGR03618 family F420-dependent PPOX class oxidoreductase [Acidimicrobiales bacterium]|nr:TIGR03618 family F420-dependent PPOX class oxidoreductase [Acidimicrobiales bacterium]
MSRREQIRMSDDEVAAFLAGPNTLQVASINADGTPHLVAMFYAVVDGEVGFWTYGKAQKVVNLRRDPRITVMVETGKTYDELKGVTITGRARLVEDCDAVTAFGEVLYPRYFGELNDAARAGVAVTGQKRIVVMVEPVKVVSWDHTKLGGTY